MVFGVKVRIQRGFAGRVSQGNIGDETQYDMSKHKCCFMYSALFNFKGQRNKPTAKTKFR
jgi:hypothetical protein